jgi:GNAT superfamily N-acetyltransferase
MVVSRGTAHQADGLPGLVAVDAAEPVDVLTYRVDGPQLEVVTLQAFQRLRGVGRTLLEAAKSIAREAGCRRLTRP